VLLLFLKLLKKVSWRGGLSTNVDMTPKSLAGFKMTSVVLKDEQIC